MIQVMPPGKLLPFINAKVKGEKNKVLLDEVVLAHVATNPKTSASNKETKLEPRTKLDEVYDNKTNTENPVRASLQSARMTETWTVNEVDHLVEMTLFVCNYPLRAVCTVSAELERLKRTARRTQMCCWPKRGSMIC